MSSTPMLKSKGLTWSSGVVPDKALRLRVPGDVGDLAVSSDKTASEIGESPFTFAFRKVAAEALLAADEEEVAAGPV